MIAVVCMASFVKVSPGGKYFQHDGKVLVPVGFNDAITWPSLISLSLTGNISAPKSTSRNFSSYGVTRSE